MIDNMLNTIALRDTIYAIVGIVTVLSVVVEKAKSLPFKPWTFLFEYIGKCITKSIDDRLDKIEQQQKEIKLQQQANIEAITELDKKVDRKFEEKQRDDDEKEAKRLRASIIKFADACRVGTRHTQSHFENVIRDYSDYVAYCDKHDIPNHFIDSEYKYIEGIYQECLRENKFL